MAVDIDSLQIEIEATSSDAASKIDQLATALTNLKSAAKGGAGLTTTTKQLQALSNAAKLINGTNLNSQKIQQFASAMNSLSAIQKASGLNSTINALKKLPEISTALDKADLGKFATQMNQVASAMRPLATEMQKVANGFSAFPIRIQKIIQSNSALTASNNKTAKSFGVLGTGISSAQAKFGVYLIAFRRLASVMSDWVKESNDYVENLNLFTVAMGDYAAEAKAYAEEVQAAMGIDPSEWMRNQGVFMQMAAGFGVATDSAALMSKNLTQLGYDISSFYNIGIEEAMEKLQSGLAGEIEPLRRLGYAIDVASLEQVALNHGITESVNAMSQAEKSQLRYIAIMEQSGNVMGDLSRTIQTPANAMRILNQQITQLSRALGNLLIPFLQQVIPWVQAFVEVLTEAIQRLAELVGFELPTIDYSGLGNLTSGAAEAEDALSGAADAAKKLKSYTIGIDELNIISPDQGAGGAGGTASAVGGLDFDLPEYDFLGDLEKNVGDIKKWMEPILEMVLDIGSAILGWKITTSFIRKLKDVIDYFKVGKKELDGWGKAARIATGLVISITGIKWSYEAGYNMGANQADFLDYVKGVLGPIASGAGGALIGSAIAPGIGSGAGFAIGFTVGVVFELIGYIQGKEAATAIDTFVTSITSGQVPIESFTSAAAAAFQELGQYGSVIAGLGDQLEAQNANVDNARVKIETYMASWQATGTVSKQEISGILEQLDLLVNTSGEKLPVAAEVLRTSLVQAMKDATAESRETYNGLLNIIYLLESNGNSTIAAWRSELNEAKMELASLDENSASYESTAAALMEKIGDLTLKIAGIGSSSSTVTDDLENLNTAVHGIDFSSLQNGSDIAVDSLNQLTEVASQAYQDLADSYNAQMTSLDELFAYVDASSPEWKAIYQEALALGLDPSTAMEDVDTVKEWMRGYYEEIYQEQLADIDALFEDTYGVLTENMYDAIDQAAREIAGEKLDPEYWESILFPEGYDQLMNKEAAAAEIQKNIDAAYNEAVQQAAKALAADETTRPLFEALESSLSSVNSKRALAGFGEGWSEDIIGGFSSGLTNDVAAAVASQGFDSLALMIDELGRDAIGAHSPADLTIPHGEYLTMGIAEGLTDELSMASLTAAEESLKTSFISYFDEMFLIGQDDSVMGGKALELLTDFSDGIVENTPLVVSSMSTLLNALIEKMEEFTNTCRDAMNGLLKDFAASMASVKVNSLGGVSYKSVSRVTIPRIAVDQYEGGGFPSYGEMFIARESGPELVGKIGNRTAVANNEQIVAGISAGVEEANQSQNVLLREQNELLRAILAKDDGVYLDGKQLKRSVDRASRNSGASILMGGVVD